MVGFGEDPGDRPSDDGTDRSDRGTGRSGTSPSGPPEDDNDDPNPSGRFGDVSGPPEDDNDDDVFTPPSRDGPPEDSGEEGGRVDDVTPSPDPGIGQEVETGIPDRDSPPEDSGEEGGRVDDVQRSDDPGIESPTDRAAPEDDFAPKPDRRGPVERREQDLVAEQTPGLTEDDIANIDRVEREGRPDRLQAGLEAPSIEQQLEQRRARARREADVDAISRLGAFDTDEIRAERAQDAVRLTPTDAAAGRRRDELAEQRVTDERPEDAIRLDPGFSELSESEQREELADEIEGVEEDDIQGIERTQDGIQVDIERSQRDIVFDTLGVDPDREPTPAARTAGEVAQTARDENLAAPADVALSVAAESARDGRLAEATESGVEFFEPTAEAVENAIAQAEETANDTPIGSSALVPNSVDREVGETFAGETAVGATAFTARAFNPGRVAQDIVQAPSRTLRAADAATNENAPSNLQTAADVSEEGAEFAAEEGPEFARENPQRAAEVGLGSALILGTSVAAPTVAARGARRLSSRAGQAVRRADSDFVADERGTGQIPRGRPDEPDTIEADEIAGRPDEPDQSSIRPEFERGEDVDPADPVQRRRDQRIQEGADDRGRDEAFRRNLERRRRAREQPDADLREATDVEPEAASGSGGESPRAAAPISGERRRLERAQRRSVTPTDPLDQQRPGAPVGAELDRLSSAQTLGVAAQTTGSTADNQPTAPEQEGGSIVEPQFNTATDVFESSFAGSDLEPTDRAAERQTPGVGERQATAPQAAQAADEALAQQFGQLTRVRPRPLAEETEVPQRITNREIETEAETEIPGRRIPTPKRVRFPGFEDEDDDEEEFLEFLGVQDIEAELDPTDPFGRES